MKRYVIRNTTGYPKIIREGQPYEVCLGDDISEDELKTLVCDRPVTVICTLDNFISTIEPGVIATPAPVAPAPVASAPAHTPEHTPEHSEEHKKSD